MPIPTDSEIDAAIPVNGVPHRGLTNSLLKAMLEAIASGATFIPTLQRATPSDGDTLTVIQSDSVVTLLIEGATPLATLHIELPQPGFSSPGQVVRIISWVDITNIDYGDADVNGALTQLFSGDGVAIQNIQDNDWLVLP